jgi:hypothetical protein
MSTVLEAVRPITLAEIEEVRRRIAVKTKKKGHASRANGRRGGRPKEMSL